MKCELCPKDYTLKSSLREHIRVVHDKWYHKCDFCEKQFSYKDNLRKHMKNSHEEKETT